MNVHFFYPLLCLVAREPFRLRTIFKVLNMKRTWQELHGNIVFFLCVFRSLRWFYFPLFGLLLDRISLFLLVSFLCSFWSWKLFFYFDTFYERCMCHEYNLVETNKKKTVDFWCHESGSCVLLLCCVPTHRIKTCMVYGEKI